ncbi:MAG: hypothetical protein IKL82_05750 [Clostridia bacterium]|nr:hypothetical protein [Clostridia bacterium]
MIAIKTTKSIVCDVNGCSNKAVFFVKKNNDENDGYSLKLCATCAKELVKALNVAIKKEKENV